MGTDDDDDDDDDNCCTWKTTIVFTPVTSMNSRKFIGERKMWRSSSEKRNVLCQIRESCRFRGTEQKWANVPALLRHAYISHLRQYPSVDGS